MKFKIYLALLISLLMAGCLVKPPPRVNSGEWGGAGSARMTGKPAPLDDLLDYYQRVNAMPEQEFQDELARVKGEAATHGTPGDLRLALLYLRAGDARKRDLGKAGSLLAGIEKSETLVSPSVRGFMALLKMFIVEQKKMRLEVVEANNNLQPLLQKNHNLEQKLQDSEQQAGVLAKKIEQLKKIEQIMSRRQGEKIGK